MIGIKLITEQKDAIHGQFYNDNCFFNCVQDINGDWFLFLSESDKAELVNTDFNYLLNLQELEYTAPIIENPFV